MHEERMKKWRKALGYTQEAMAERMHMDQATYSRMESGRRKPTAEELERFCAVIGITLDTFLNGDLPQSPLNGSVVNGTKSPEGAESNAAFLRDMLDRRDRQLEESQSLMRTALDMLRSTLEHLRKRPLGGGGNALRIRPVTGDAVC